MVHVTFGRLSVCLLLVLLGLAVVTLPSPHHRWSVSNSSVANVDSTMGITKALSLGVTDVIVKDTRVASHTQVSSLKVVLPDLLSLYMTPLSVSGHPEEGIEAIPSKARWYVVSGRQYLIQIKVFAQGSDGSDVQEIYITEVIFVPLVLHKTFLCT